MRQRLTVRPASPDSAAMLAVVRPAAPAFDASGTPYSREFADVYHSAASGPGQARHVFLRGNDLPARWAGRRIFTIFEAGFGLGVNFMTTWLAWRADPARCDRLHFVSVERQPFLRGDLAAMHARYPELADASSELCAAWPPLLPGMHRIHLDSDRVVLTLCFGDVRAAIPQMRLAADAFYLDGFAPQRNPDMWEPRLMRSIARLAAPNATLATYTAARSVADALAAAGFAMEKRSGFAAKREMLAGRYAPHWPMRMLWRKPAHREQSAIIVGAGLAGAAVAARLAARGWRLDVVERNASPAREASGMLAGVLQPHISYDDAILSRLSRAGFLYARRACGDRSACGVLQLAIGAKDEARMEQALSRLEYPGEYAQYRSRADASELAGQRVPAGGWWFPTAGFVRPQAVALGQLAAAGQATALHVHLGRNVAALRRVEDRWQALDADAQVIAEAQIVVLANACDAARLANLDPAKLALIRGQLTLLPAAQFASPHCVISGSGYVLPAIDGISIAGASYDTGRTDTLSDAAAHEANLRRAEDLLPGSTARVDRSTLQTQIGFRCVAPDRLPMIGALVDIAATRAEAGALAGAHLPDLPRIGGLYGALAYASRGLAWSPLGAEALASEICGEPAPIEAALSDAIDPGRFVLRRLRHGAFTTAPCAQ